MQDDFDEIKALYTYRRILKKAIDRKHNLIKTIDKTNLYLRGKETMSNEELYYGFDSERQKEYEKSLVKYHGTVAENRIFESKKRTAKWDKEEWDQVKNSDDTIYKELTTTINAGLQSESDAVQSIIHRHYQLQARFFDITKDIYIKFTQLYSEHPDFKIFFNTYHPKMIEFISEAMRFYANEKL